MFGKIFVYSVISIAVFAFGVYGWFVYQDFKAQDVIPAVFSGEEENNQSEQECTDCDSSEINIIDGVVKEIGDGTIRITRNDTGEEEIISLVDSTSYRQLVLRSGDFGLVEEKETTKNDLTLEDNVSILVSTSRGVFGAKTANIVREILVQ